MEYTYVLTTYKGDSLSKEDCYIFQSEFSNLSEDSANNPDVPMVLGGNQTIYDIEDAPYIPPNN